MKRNFLVRMMLALLVLVGVAAVSEAATISGTVTNNSGKTGRIYLSLQWSDGGDAGGYGVSIAQGVTSYSIRGVQMSGTYVLKAFQDVQTSGSQHANDPVGTSAPFDLTGGADVANISVALNNPPAVALQPPAGAGVVAGDGGALVVWDPAYDTNGKEIATSYKVYWSTNPSPGPLNMIGGGSSLDLPSNDKGAYLRAFTNGAKLYFAVTAKLNGVESAPTNANGGAQITIGAPAGGHTVSGTVTTSGGAVLGANTPLYIALGAGNGPPVYVARVASPTTSQAYTIAGVLPGDYQIYVIVDMNNNGLIDLGDIENTDSNGVPITVGSTNLTGANVALAASPAQIALRTKHWKNDLNEGYGLNIEVRPSQKRPVNIAVTGPKLAGPIDMGLSSWGGFGIWPDISARPTLSPADTYSFAIGYSDGTSTGASPLTAAVNGIVDSFATPTAPVGYIQYPFTSGDFTWSAPTSPPSPYTYSFWLNVQGFNSDQYSNMPSSTTSVPYFPYPYADGNFYSWNVSVNDSLGNSAERQVGFSPTTSPGINSFSPTSGVPGNQVVISGINFGATPANNQVYFNGVLATITAASSTSLTVTVPGTATTGPISVNNLTSGRSAISLTQFTIIPPPVTTANPAGGTKTGPIDVFLTTNQPATIYYTTSGANPTTSSASFVDSVGNVAKGPIHITSTTTLKYFAVGSAGNTEAIKTELYFYGTPTTLSLGLGGISSITYGDSLIATATITSGAGPTGMVQFFVDGSPYGAAVPLGGTLATLVISGLTVIGSPHSITASYGGDATYAGSTAPAATVTVAKANSSVTTWPTAGAITYGQTLAASILSGGSATPAGSFAFTAPSTVPNAGTAAQSVTYTPADTANYNIATSTVSVTVNKAAATITLGSLSQTYTGAARVATATTVPAGLTVNFTYDLSATAPTNAGSYAVVGTISDTNYQGSASGTLTVAKANQTITFGALANKNLGDPPFTLSATSSSGLPVSFSLTAGTSVTLSGTNNSTATLTGTPGQSTIQASQAGDTNYNAAAPVSQSFYVRSGQTITFNALAAKTYGDAPFALTATASSTLPVSYVSSDTTVATVSGSTVTILKAGTTTITASQAGDATYNPAPSVAQTLTVNKATATITLGSLTQTYNGTARAATAVTVPAGLTVNFTYDLSATAPTNAGSYAVVGTISDTNYQGSASGTLTVAKATATVTLGSLSQTYNGTARTATATTVPAGLTVNFTYDLSATAPTNAGSYAVVGTISDTNYQGSASGTLTVAKANQTITFGALANKNLGDPPFTLSATSSSGLPVSFSLTAGTSVTLSGTNNSTATLTGTPGQSTIQASQAGDTNYNAAAPVSQSFYVRSGQTITFNALAAKTYGDAPFALTATASSTLPVSYVSSDTTVATVSGSTVTILKAGTTTITASQAGDATYNPAPSVPQTLTVNKAAATITLGSLSQTYTGTARAATAVTVPAGLTVNFTYDLSATAPTNAGSYAVVGTISDTNYQGSASGTLTVAKAAATITLGSLSQTYTGTARVATATTVPAGLTVTFTYDLSATAPTNAGSYAVVGTISDTNYQGSASGTLTVAKAIQTITFSPASLTDKLVGAAPFSVTASANSGLPVTVSIASGPATYLAPIVTLGTPTPANYIVTVQATQAGDGNYNSATISTTFKLLQYGDINGDGTLNLTDILQYLQVTNHEISQPAYLGNVLLAPLVNHVPTPGSRTRADVRDASLALEKYVGNW